MPETIDRRELRIALEDAAEQVGGQHVPMMMHLRELARAVENGAQFDDAEDILDEWDD